MAYDNEPQAAAADPSLPNLLRRLEGEHNLLNKQRDELQKHHNRVGQQLEEINRMCETLMAGIAQAKEYLPHIEPDSVPMPTTSNYG